MDISRRSFVAGSAAALGLGGSGRLFHSRPLAPAPGAGMWATSMLPRDGTPGAPADDARMAWWRDARFGMFIHWGLYSILAGQWEGRSDHAEWIRTTAHIPLKTYDLLVHRFNPTRFDPDAWVGMAKDAGMKYVTITSKHHDGFCLFDNSLTSFCIRSTPYKRDIMKLMADACRRAGLHQCWYHSIMDWHHPDYLPRRDWEAATRPVDGARYSRFVRYLHGSVEQLLKNYGEIGVMWFDGNWEQTWTHEMGRALYQECRRLQPSVIVNNRVEGWQATPITDPLGDFSTPEQEVPATGLPGVDWESCITMNDHWGYNLADHDFKSVPALIGLLVETASKGGNLLLNVGPKADGTFPDESVERLAAIGKWMAVNGDAIHGTTASVFSSGPFRSTTKGNKAYLFLTEWPEADTLPLPGLKTPVTHAYSLADPSKTAIVVNSVGGGAAGAGNPAQSLILPRNAPDPVCSVVVLEFDTAPVVG